MKTLLITGGAGFIGANFVHYMLEQAPNIFLLNLDKLTYAGHKEHLEGLPPQRHKLVVGDICDKDLLDSLFTQHNIEGVIHFAAESHVDNSIEGPEAFVQTNITGTFRLLEAARHHWLEKPHQAKAGKENCRFHHISTDEVYGSLGPQGAFTESTPYAPNSPYSASKAASDMLVRSYFKTYGLNTVTTNCSNNFGPRQHIEKLIPTIIRKALALEPIPIYGTGKNVRDWLYVTDHCQALYKVFEKGRAGQTYNVGGDSEKTNIDMARLISAKLDQKQPRQDGKSYADLITFVADRPGHDLRYAIDPGKIKNELGWQPATSFEQGIAQTIDWYLENLQA